jgi:pimeloyl-ACP methyl ester carboxylesterase
MPKAFIALLRLMPGYRTMVTLAPTLRHDMALTADPPELDVAAEIGSPVHVLVGERSPSSLHGVAAALAASLHQCEVTVVAGQDHMVAAKAILPMLVERLSKGSSVSRPDQNSVG